MTSEEGYKEKKEDRLLRIARHLILNASFTSNLGLYHGKMGIVLFFAHYARYTGNSLYDDFAGELLDEIYEEIHMDTSISFESGLCGIGWGIEYLLQQNFMSGDSDEILSDIDKKIMERDLRRISDFSLETGLKGILCYIDKRLQSKTRKQSSLPFDNRYLSDYEYVRNKIDESIPEEKQIISTLLEKLPEGENITTWNLGLENGCAGFGLKQIVG